MRVYGRYPGEEELGGEMRRETLAEVERVSGGGGLSGEIGRTGLDVRRDVFLLPGVHAARTAHAAHHLVEHEQRAVLGADGFHRREVARHGGYAAEGLRGSIISRGSRLDLTAWGKGLTAPTTGSATNAHTLSAPTRVNSSSSSCASRCTYASVVSPSSMPRYALHAETREILSSSIGSKSFRLPRCPLMDSAPRVVPW